MDSKGYSFSTAAFIYTENQDCHQWPSLLKLTISQLLKADMIINQVYLSMYIGANVFKYALLLNYEASLALKSERGAKMAPIWQLNNNHYILITICKPLKHSIKS